MPASVQSLRKLDGSTLAAGPSACALPTATACLWHLGDERASEMKLACLDPRLVVTIWEHARVSASAGRWPTVLGPSYVNKRKVGCP